MSELSNTPFQLRVGFWEPQSEQGASIRPRLQDSAGVAGVTELLLEADEPPTAGGAVSGAAGSSPAARAADAPLEPAASPFASVQAAAPDAGPPAAAVAAAGKPSSPLVAAPGSQASGGSSASSELSLAAGMVASAASSSHSSPACVDGGGGGAEGGQPQPSPGRVQEARRSTGGSTAPGRSFGSQSLGSSRPAFASGDSFAFVAQVGADS